MPSRLHRKYAINEHFFDTWTPDSAYIAGWIAGDGSVDYKNWHLVLMGSDKEREHLGRMSLKLGFEGAVSVRREKAVFVRICCKKLIQGLSCLGVKKIGGITEVGEVPELMIPSFIRGLFDSDGYVGKQKTGLVVQIRGTSRDMISWAARCFPGAGLCRDVSKNPLWADVYTAYWYADRALGFVEKVAPRKGELFLERKWDVMKSVYSVKDKSEDFKRKKRREVL